MDLVLVGRQIIEQPLRVNRAAGAGDGNEYSQNGRCLSRNRKTMAAAGNLGKAGVAGDARSSGRFVHSATMADKYSSEQAEGLP